MKLHGSYVALTTPFRKGAIDYAALKRQVEFQIQAGTSGLVPCGTTGESPTLSHAEHNRVIEAVVASARGRVQVIAGAGSNSTQEAVSLSRHAKKAGADAVLSVVPYYNKPTQAGLYQHFKTIALKAHIPIVLYNIPGRCGTGLTVTTVEALAKIKEIVAIKEATGSLDQASEIIARTDLSVLSGDDSLTLPLLSVGASGVVSVMANLFPEDVARLLRAFSEGHLGLAQRLHYQMFRLIKTLFVETNPIPVKAALKILRRDTGECRLPLSQAQPATRALIAKALKRYSQARTVLS